MSEDRPAGATCEIALDGEVLTAYTAGRLGAADAEVFERHYFHCEECWTLVRAAAATREGFADGAGAARAMGRRPRWAVLLPATGLAAAVAALALFGVRSDGPPTAEGEIFRGEEQLMALEVTAAGTTLRTSWSPVAGAQGYELRVFDASDRVLRAFEVETEALAFDLDLISPEGGRGAAFVDVVALDALGQVLRRSPRVSLQP